MNFSNMKSDSGMVPIFDEAGNIIGWEPYEKKEDKTNPLREAASKAGNAAAAFGYGAAQTPVDLSYYAARGADTASNALGYDLIGDEGEAFLEKVKEDPLYWNGALSEHRTKAIEDNPELFTAGEILGAGAGAVPLKMARAALWTPLKATTTADKIKKGVVNTIDKVVKDKYHPAAWKSSRDMKRDMKGIVGTGAAVELGLEPAADYALEKEKERRKKEDK